MKSKLLAGLSAIALISASPLANANLVANGDFETGDFSGWTRSGNPGIDGGIGFGGTGYAAVCPGCGVGGSYGVMGGLVGSDGIISQVLNTTAGSIYTISLDFLSSGYFTNHLAVSFDGVSLFDQLDIPASNGFSHYSFNGIASGASTLLQVNFRNDPWFDYIDNVSVEHALGGDHVGGSQIPEPASLALTGLALAGLGMTRKRG